MAKSKFRENLIGMQCVDCKRINYHTRKNKKTHSGKLAMQKYCRWCRKRTNHKETKKL